MVGVNIVSKAFMQAYQQAKSGGGGAVASAVRVSTRMPLDQAKGILNLEAATIDRNAIISQFNKYYMANEPEKGGSFYIQSKIFNAKEALLEDLARKTAASAAAAKPMA